MTDFAPLVPIEERWPQVFGESLGGVGFEIFPDDVPMLERCLEAKSTAELDQALRVVKRVERAYRSVIGRMIENDCLRCFNFFHLALLAWFAISRPRA